MLDVADPFAVQAAAVARDAVSTSRTLVAKCRDAQQAQDVRGDGSDW